MKRLPPTIIFFILFVTEAAAETSKHQSLLGTNNEIISSSFRMVWGLLIVLGIILLLYGLLRKRFSLLATSTDKEIKIIEIKPLMGKKALCLVEVRGKELLLGISDSQITHLASLTEEKHTSFSETLRQESGEFHE